MTDQLTAIADRTELAELVARQAIWLDEHRLDGIEAVFTDDVVARTPGGEVEGSAALAELAHRSHDEYAHTHHIPAGIVVDLDGDGAEVRFSNVVMFTLEDGDVLVRSARYRVEARRTDAGWRFFRLEITPAAGTAPLQGA